ncbi:MAG TPA: hypothetical protein VIG99_05695 [Myxococcaceae bacterium]|jgi:hypothetical protein
MFKTRAVAMALAVAGGFTAQAAFAGEVARDRMEKAQDRQEMRQDGRQAMDDRLDVAKLEATLAELDRVRSRPRPMEVAMVDRKAMELMRAEAMESRMEMAQKAGEVRKDNAELRSDHREVRQDTGMGMPVKAANDTRDLRDDRRDKRDDQRDLAKEQIQASRRHQIAVEYRGLVNRIDRPSMDRKRALLVELIGIARTEVRGDHQEMREDHREMREDRREIREDLRDRRR